MIIEGVSGYLSKSTTKTPKEQGLEQMAMEKAQQEWEGYGFTDEEKMGFAALVLAPIVITQALGKYHRVKGYAPDQVAKDFGFKPLPPGSSSNLLKDEKMNPLEAIGASMKGLMDSFNKPETPDKKRK